MMVCGVFAVYPLVGHFANQIIIDIKTGKLYGNIQNY
jgi:hypothetical protein